MDCQDFENAAEKLVHYIIEYRTGANKRQFNVLPDMNMIRPGYLYNILPNKAPECSEQFDEILKDVIMKIMPGVTHWQHPGFHAFYPTCTSYPTMLGDLLASAIGCVGFTWLACPACTELEVITMDWLVHALNLPEKFLSATGKGDPTHTGGGVIELSASMACATLTMGLRDRMLRNHIKNPQLLTESDYLSGNGPGSLVDRMVAYTSDQAHSSVTRAFRIAMINSRVIKSKRHNQCLIFDPDDLRQEIEKDLLKGFIPLVCVATMGTTSTCEFEDLYGIGQVCKDYNIWFHVDAAYGGIALLCPEFHHLSKGIEFADSLNINAHKMMMVNVESSPLWLSDYRVLTEAFETNPLYLQHTYKGMPDYRHAKLAREFEKLLLADGRFQITNCVRFGLVCFQLKNDNQLTMALHEELTKKGEIFLVLGCTEINQESKHRKEVEDGEIIENSDKLTKVTFLRFVCIHGTTMDDIKFAYEKISLAATYILDNVEVSCS
ncbi:hypothetical protein MN116_006352 [Schistosoma mekongi]|uniref:Aromatic-L-amino-acid decarboxylase n=1 Tax=Schistosoma mekongi TaxID=38744 RepID=A0AAE1ZB77_SCHME|nr:hypothetical protein MN116_006352 [Schistosoma mekongi]